MYVFWGTLGSFPCVPCLFGLVGRSSGQCPQQKHGKPPLCKPGGFPCQIFNFYAFILCCTIPDGLPSAEEAGIDGAVVQDVGGTAGSGGKGQVELGIAIDPCQPWFPFRRRCPLCRKQKQSRRTAPAQEPVPWSEAFSYSCTPFEYLVYLYALYYITDRNNLQ